MLPIFHEAFLKARSYVYRLILLPVLNNFKTKPKIPYCRFCLIVSALAHGSRSSLLQLVERLLDSFLLSWKIEFVSLLLLLICTISRSLELMSGPMCSCELLKLSRILYYLLKKKKKLVYTLICRRSRYEGPNKLFVLILSTQSIHSSIFFILVISFSFLFRPSFVFSWPFTQ